MAFFKVAVIALLVAVASAAPSQNPANVAEYERAIANGEEFDNNPQYNYEFQVADDKFQTYISQTENRDGDNVNGEYSYVDPTGALVTVVYSSGLDGYTEERSVQENFVTIRAKPAKKITTSTTSSGFSAPTTTLKKTVTTKSSSTGASDSDLVAKILAQLTPFIRKTVSNSLAGQETTTTVVSEEPVAVTRTTQTSQTSQTSPVSATQSLFGVSGDNNIKFTTPEFNYAFDL